MRVNFIVANPDNSWTLDEVEVPPEAVPDKYTVGSTKWRAKAVAWRKPAHPQAVYVGIIGIHE